VAPYGQLSRTPPSPDHTPVSHRDRGRRPRLHPTRQPAAAPLNTGSGGPASARNKANPSELSAAQVVVDRHLGAELPLRLSRTTARLRDGSVPVVGHRWVLFRGHRHGAMDRLDAHRGPVVLPTVDSYNPSSSVATGTPQHARTPAISRGHRQMSALFGWPSCAHRAATPDRIGSFSPIPSDLRLYAAGCCHG
jgi:hypothetical protein